MTTSTGYAHIELDDDGTPGIAGTRFTVAFVARAHTVRGYTAAEIVEAYPSLTPAEVHSALAYYFDHKAQIERQIEAERQERASLRTDWADSQAKLRADLRARGKLP
jgi:uncharacterized protein (DUF433 family)